MSWTNVLASATVEDVISTLKARDIAAAIRAYPDSNLARAFYFDVLGNRFREFNVTWQDRILSIAGGGLEAGTVVGARTSLGLGTLATQNSNSVSISAGDISGVRYAGNGSGITDLDADNFASGTIDAARLPANIGVVKQVKAAYHYVVGSDTTYSGTSWTAASIQAPSITPTSASSKFLIIIWNDYVNNVANAESSGTKFRIRQYINPTSTFIWTGGVGSGIYGTRPTGTSYAMGRNRSGNMIVFDDAPATTSPIVYSVDISNTSVNGSTTYKLYSYRFIVVIEHE